MSKISIWYILTPLPHKTFICSFSSILLEGRGKGLILADGHNFGATGLFQNREEYIANYQRSRLLHIKIHGNNTNRQTYI